MANYTENLNLKKPTDDDFYDVEDFNYNMDVLDGEVAKKSDISAEYDGDFVFMRLKGKNITVDISEEERLLTLTYLNSDNSLVIRNFKLFRIGDKIGASMLNITPEELGAAPSVHAHSASDILSGSLPIARGGTGASTANGALNNLGLKGISVSFMLEQSYCLDFTGTLQVIPALGIVIMDGCFTVDSFSAGGLYKLGNVPTDYSSKNAKYTPLRSSVGQIYISGQSIMIKTDSAVSENEKIGVSGFWCYR